MKCINIIIVRPSQYSTSSARSYSSFHVTIFDPQRLENPDISIIGIN